MKGKVVRLKKSVQQFDWLLARKKTTTYVRRWWGPGWQFRRHWHSYALGIVLIGGWIAYTTLMPLFAVSATKTITTQADWEAGEYYNGTVDTKTAAGNLKIQSGSVGTWNNGTPGFPYDNAGYDYWTYDGSSYGASLATDGTYMYQIVGNRKPYLFRYNPETNTWKQLANAPTSFFYGGSMTYDGAGHLYAIDGGDANEITSPNNATKHLFKYDIATDTWSREANDAPDIWTLGSSITSDKNGKIYAMRAYYSAQSPDAFWVYNTATGVWNSTLPTTQSNFSSTNGQGLIFVNEPYPAGSPTSCTTGCVFAINGGATAVFNRYDIAENQWYASVTGMGNAGYGASLSYDSVNGDIYLHNGNQLTTFSSYDVSAGTWNATPEDTQGTVYNGGASVYMNVNGTGYIYQTKGYAVPDLWRYNLTTAQWESVATPTTTATVGNAGEDGLMVYVATGVNQCLDASGCLFVFRGAATATFWRYNIGARTWTTTLTTTNLGTLQYGASVCQAGNTLYAQRGTNTVSFYSYDLTAADPGSAWTVLTSMPTTHTGGTAYPASPTAANVGYGGSIACLGSTVYTMKGFGGTYYSNHFYSYTGGAWSQQTVTPQRLGAGSAIVAVPNGASCADATGCIFALMGNQRGDWYRYNISATTWTQLTDIPTATNYTASLTYDGSGNIYAISGDYDRKMWRYNISGNSWTRVADFPGKAGYANALAYDTAANIIYAVNGMSTAGIYKFTPTTNNYITTATWISGIQDLSYVSAWEQLSSTLTTGGTSTVKLSLRSSTDKVTWSAWEDLVTGGTGPTISQDISGATTPKSRYIQIKVTLTSDGTNTPSVGDVTVTYTKDSTAPVNPTATGYADSTKGTTIASGSYYYTNPYFELSGATDTSGSGVAGYYAAWTTTSGFDPSSSENYYQTGTTYTVNTDMVTASPGPIYYLRVATKDNAGNVSSPATLFTYTYNGIAAASTTAWTSQASFEAAGTTSSNLNTAANSGADMTLASVSPGTWMDLPAVASNNTLTGLTAYNDSSVVWDGSDTIYFLRSINTQSFLKYTISTKLWTSLTNTGAAAQYGSALVYVPPGVSAGCADASGCVFATMGGAGTGFRRYNIQANTWDARTVVSGTVGYGGGLIYNGADYIYASRGGGQLEFYRYTISTDTWTGRASVEAGFNQGASYAYVPTGTYCADASGCIFATQGASTNHFWRYDISVNSWGYLTAPPTASPTKGNYGGTMVYNAGYLYFIAGYASTDFLKYDIANDLWTTLVDLPATHYYGSTNAIVYDTSTDTIYTPRMYNEYSFISYDVVNNKWRNPAIPQGQSSNGFYYGGIAFDGTDTMYVARGNATNDFYKYTISTQAWQRLNDIPLRMNSGSDLVYVNGTVYALTGAVINAEALPRLYSYNPTTDNWTRLADMPVSIGQGTKLVWDGSNTIYTARGGGNTTFYSYSISGNTWSLQASTIPGAINDGGCAVVNDANSYIYMSRGTATRNIYRCTINQGAGTCTWSIAGTLTDSPLAQGNNQYGGACALDGDNIFVPQGNTTSTNFLVYSIGGNSWTNRTLNNFYYYGRLLEGPNNILYGFRGYSTSTMDRYVQQSSTMSFQRIGTWTSQILNLGSVYKLADLTVNESTQANTSLKYETRTCSNAGCAADANNVNWLGWVQTTNKRTIGTTSSYTVGSTTAQYAQVRVTFTSDRIYTPTVNDFTLSYYVDGTAPNNPSAPISGYTDSGKGTAITNNTWANDLTPYFEWTSTDNTGGIGVDGYYVYFGTDSSKDPVTNASDATNLAYKTGTNYYAASLTGGSSWNALTQSASALTDGIYYLRIKARDRNNNIAAAAVDAYTFKVDGNVPAAISDLSVATYMLSTDTFSFSWTEPSDVGPSGVSQYCYHTGSSSDTCVAKASICTGGTCTVSPVVHYQTRVNTFYVMAKDTAGNNAASYASTGYFYTGGPPAAPASATVTPSSQTDSNAFAVSWAKPSSCLGATPCAEADILRYCYTINKVPSVANCGTNYSGNSTPSPDGGWTTETQTTGRQLPTFSAATQQGTNTVYVVAMDVVNNINYDSYTSRTYTFTSNAPGPPAGMTASDSSDRANHRYSITLTWDVPTNVGSGVEGYKIYRCTTGCVAPDPVDDPPANYTSIATVNTLGYLDTSLDTALTYSYFVRATGTGATISGNSAVVAMKPEGKFKSAPAMSGNPTTKIRIRSAEISWLTQDDVDKDGNPVAHPASSYIKYGPTTGYADGETGTSDLVKEHTVTLTNLLPNTTYHYQLKWTDVDGNVGLSSDYSMTTLGAPSAPTGVTATPSTGTSNSFAFSWTKPADEGVTVASYRYSVNTTPTADNSASTTATSVPAYAAATRQNSNTFYVVAVDDGGNVNYANYASVDFTAHTAPPGTPRNVTIIDSSDRDAKRYNITLTWDPPVGVSSQSDSNSSTTYTILRSEDDGLTFTSIATLKSTGYLDTGLTSTKKYTYKITAQDSAGAASADTTPVAKVPEGRYTSPPAITKAPTPTPDSFSAVITWSTERQASSFVDFGPSADNLPDEQGTADLVIDHSVKVTGLKAQTAYSFKIKSIDVDQNIAFSDVSSFTTLEAPRVLNVKISDVRLKDAIISWEVNKEATALINYGSTTKYGLSYTADNATYSTKHTVKLENLSDGTTYHLRLGGTDRNDNPIESDDYQFTTLTFPKVSDISTTNKSQGQTEVLWKTNVPTTSSVEYYGDTIPPKTQGNASLVTDHSVLLFGLQDATKYKFKIHGADQFGYEAVSPEQNFTTLEDTTPPEVFGVKSESNTIGSGETSKIQIVVSWKTNEATTSKVEFGVGISGDTFTSATDENAELMLDHLVVIGDLAQAKTYHFRVVSRDKAGNQTKSGSNTVLTTKKKESFIQLIIANLENTFSWLGNIGKLGG